MPAKGALRIVKIVAAAALGTSSLGKALRVAILRGEKLQPPAIFAAPDLHPHGTSPYIGPVSQQYAGFSQLNVLRKCVGHLTAAAQTCHGAASSVFHPQHPFL